MKITPQLHCEAPRASNEVKASVLFVDLDETLLDGTVGCMLDEELDEADVIYTTFNLIQNARNLGIPVVMVTRNKTRNINRFFESKSELLPLFDDVISCQGEKSHLINCYLSAHGIEPENSLFVDDNPVEIDDVKSIGVKTVYPHNTSNIILDKPKLTKEKVTDITRYKSKRVLNFFQTDYITLAA